MLIDLHCHSAERSDDASSSLAELAAAARAAGLDGICVTDHDTFWPREALEETSRATGILLIPGCEVNTDSGHALVFGPDEYRFGFHHPERLAAAVVAAGGALVQSSAEARTAGARMRSLLSRSEPLMCPGGSRGKARDLHLAYLPHLRPPVRMTSGFGYQRPLAHQTVALYAVRVPQAEVLPQASFPPHLAVTQLPFG